MLISPAYAQGAAAPAGLDIMQFAPLVLIFVVFYFLLIRPQRTKMKAHQEMIKNVRRGDTIVTNGGLVGKISKVVDEAEIEAGRERM